MRPAGPARQAKPPAPPLQTRDLFWWRRRFRLRVAIHHAVVLVAALSPVWGQIAKPAGTTEPAATLNPAKSLRIPPQAFVGLEKSFDTRLATLAFADDPVDVLGLTRGFYLDGYGVFFSTDVSLVVTPELNPFRREITKELAARVRQRRVERLPLLKTAMKEMVRKMATTFNQVPPSQQVVLAVRLYYGSWEDSTGMPAQIIMKADRASALAGDIKMEEQ
jgi:hypothetical protein